MRHPTPFELWQGGLEVSQMLIETQMVIAYRLLGIAGFWPVAASENHRMVAEKAPAFFEASAAAARAAAAGGRPDEVVGAWVKPLRRRTKRNASRLGRRGMRGGS